MLELGLENPNEASSSTLENNIIQCVRYEGRAGFSISTRWDDPKVRLISSLSQAWSCWKEGGDSMAPHQSRQKRIGQKPSERCKLSQGSPHPRE